MFLSSCKWQTWKNIQNLWTTSTNTRPIDLNIKYSTCADDRRIEVIADNLTFWGLHFFPAYFSSPHLTLDCAAQPRCYASICCQPPGSRIFQPCQCGREWASFGQLRKDPSTAPAAAAYRHPCQELWLRFGYLPPPKPGDWLSFFPMHVKLMQKYTRILHLKKMASVLHRTLRSHAM